MCVDDDDAAVGGRVATTKTTTMNEVTERRGSDRSRVADLECHSPTTRSTATSRAVLAAVSEAASQA